MNDGGDGNTDNELTSAQFLASCDTYYQAPIGVAWDLDRNGTFEPPRIHGHVLGGGPRRSLHPDGGRPCPAPH